MPKGEVFNANLAELKRLFENDAKVKYAQLPLVKNVLDPFFVAQFMEVKGLIHGYGTNTLNGEALLLPMNFKPSVFVVSDSVECLDWLIEIENSFLDNKTMRNGKKMFKVIETGVFLKTNNYSIFDTFTHPDRCRAPKQLIKLETRNVAQAMVLYQKLKTNPAVSKLAAIPMRWDVNWIVVCEQLYRQSVNGDKKFDLNINFKWFNTNLQTFPHLVPLELPSIVYDIETVAPNNMRVPTGEELSDALFSMSVYHSLTNTMYTLVYLPVNELALTSRKFEKLLKEDGYPTKYENFSNKVEMFFDQKMLVTRSMELLVLPKNQLHTINGFNSDSYDAKFMWKTCQKLHVSTQNFVWNGGSRFGLGQIGVDLFRFVKVFYNQLPEHNLNYVSSYFCGENKVDVSAVRLRDTFRRVYEKKGYLTCAECEKLNVPNLVEALHYNNQDTWLVARIAKQTNQINRSVDKSNLCGFNLSIFNSTYNLMAMPVWSNCFIAGLENEIFFDHFKNYNKPLQAIPFVDEDGFSDCRVSSLNISSQLLTGETNRVLERKALFTKENFKFGPDQDKSFPGGFNFNKEICQKNSVEMYDLKIAYTKMIVDLNISEETCTILPASIWLRYFDTIQNKADYKAFDYMAHHAINKTQRKIVNYEYVYAGKYCGGSFDFTNKQELINRADDPVILIWQACPGVLSEITKLQNIKREQYDALSGSLSTFLQTLENFDVDQLAENAESTVEELVEDEEQQDVFMETNENEEEGFGFDFGEEEEEEEEREEEMNSEGTSAEKKFNFEKLMLAEYGDDYFQVLSSGSLKINVAALAALKNGALIREIFNKVKILINDEKVFCENQYLGLKTINSSLYGCLGQQNPVCAAIVTCLVRTFLIKSAQYLVARKFSVWYCDTDSIFVTPPEGKPAEDMSEELNKKFVYVKFVRKVADKCLFRKTKTYMKKPMSTDPYIYGLNSNGALEFRRFVNFSDNYCEKNKLSNLADVDAFFSTFVRDVYQRFCPLEMSLDSELPQSVKDEFQYKLTLQKNAKTETPAEKFRKYMYTQYPNVSETERKQ